VGKGGEHTVEIHEYFADFNFVCGHELFARRHGVKGLSLQDLRLGAIWRINRHPVAVSQDTLVNLLGLL
jgi:hypothetical protein